LPANVMQFSTNLSELDDELNREMDKIRWKCAFCAGFDMHGIALMDRVNETSEQFQSGVICANCSQAVLVNWLSQKKP
jgi:hypothetical protein